MFLAVARSWLRVVHPWVLGVWGGLPGCGLGLFVLVGRGCSFGGWLRVVHPWVLGVWGGLPGFGVGCR